MADTPSITRPDSQDTIDTTLDVRLPPQSPSPPHDYSDTAALVTGFTPSDTLTAAYDLKYGSPQVADAAGRFEESSSKMYICHLCDFRTAFRNSLLNHQAVHSDFRPWVCAVCEYAAKRKQDLKKHLHTIHGLMVESTMLKPIGLPGTNYNATSGSLSRGESGDDNSWDDIKGNKMSDLESVHPSPHFLQAVTDMSHNMTSSHLPAATEMLSVSIKQEKLESTSQKPLPSMSNFISKSPSDLDCDLPISFSTGLISKDGMANLPQSTPKSSDASFRSNRIYSSIQDKSKSSKDIKLSVAHSKHMSDSDFSPPTRKRPRMYPVDSQTYSETCQDHIVPPLIKSEKIVDCDDLPCSSSSAGAGHTRGNQTQTCFMCEFCDIMFFQRAMYLMHAGLHSPENPWCCAVCGSSFTEKYSFTSHFINQH